MAEIDGPGRLLRLADITDDAGDGRLLSPYAAANLMLRRTKASEGLAARRVGGTWLVGNRNGRSVRIAVILSLHQSLNEGLVLLAVNLLAAVAVADVVVLDDVVIATLHNILNERNGLSGTADCQGSLLRADVISCFHRMRRVFASRSAVCISDGFSRENLPPSRL